MKDWEEKLKEGANSVWDRIKASVMKFNDRSLLSKLMIMAILHYSLRAVMGGKSGKKDVK